ncbi:ribosome production factor 2 homolog [Halichondria panicea]|uniref:ribosome production factor 2 homolog n=1 Tax=Halichondria panicea TaxID=6063 RepID=UPI00312BC185
MERVVKPKNQRVKRALERQEAKLIENTKNALFFRGTHSSEVVSMLLKDFYALKKPDAVVFQRKNDVRPFEDASKIEFFSRKNDSSLFMFGSHSKKRPNNIVIGRLFSHQVLDMIELGVENYKSRQSFKLEGNILGSKPCLIFSGDQFETESTYARLKNLLIDFFHGPTVSQVRLAGLDHVMTFTVFEGKIYCRNYRISLKKSGTKVPRVELAEVGPSVDFVLRRTQLANDQIIKEASRQPKATKVKTVKNVSRDAFGTKLGRVHMKRQDFSKLQTRKLKGLKQTLTQKRTSGSRSHSRTTKTH